MLSARLDGPRALGVREMIRRRGKIQRGLVVFGSALTSIPEFALSIWRSENGKRWLIPLVVFLCATGLLLIAAASVEALAPFIYAIF
jgi:hypothetical protein